ncbi:T9SS type A sorting domain-containing protein [Flavobacterium hydrophilum]|uniref:T9SS type A sorting domain-containing protein n=1 Tax=Flavobacterium hydrophilum TaxID=2211445 RepID=UPI0014025811|nr:T9SS type A sorting domain-containing protein [Flavobacterium hydrophilum]
MKNLYCDNNKLTTLDISENTALKALICDYNQLATLNTSKNTALTQLTCSSNPLTSLDLSNNTALLHLQCFYSPLTTLDLSMNTALQNLSCYSGSLTTLDLSKNIALKSLDCHSNSLTTLDISKNIALETLHCYSNQLTSLNLKNGKNTVLTNLNCKSNSTLSCIEVDDVSYSNTNWNLYKDATAIFSLSCPTLGTSETVFDKIAVYPNPVKGELHIDNSTLEKATVYDALGKLMTTTKFTKNTTNNNINLAGLQNGIYYIYLENEGASIVKKIIVK